MQYRETDFNFVSRLMEEEGIFYFFEHADGKHKMILGDKATAYVDCTQKEVDYPIGLRLARRSRITSAAGSTATSSAPASSRRPTTTSRRCRSEFPPFVEVTDSHHSLCHFANEVYWESRKP